MTASGRNWHRSGRVAHLGGIENVDDGELWETHLSLKSRMLDFIRRRAMEQAKRRGESADELQPAGHACSPRMR
jgi:starch phosphorylase